MLENPKRVATLGAVIAMQDYTRAELLLGMKRMPMANSYNQGFAPHVLDAIVQQSRAVRRIVADPQDGRPRLLTRKQMHDVCQEHDGDLRPSDFGICGYDGMDNPMFVYAKQGGQTHAPNPTLPELSASTRTSEGTGVFPIAEAVASTDLGGDGAAPNRKAA